MGRLAVSSDPETKRRQKMHFSRNDSSFRLETIGCASPQVAKFSVNRAVVPFSGRIQAFS